MLVFLAVVNACVSGPVTLPGGKTPPDSSGTTPTDTGYSTDSGTTLTGLDSGTTHDSDTTPIDDTGEIDAPVRWDKVDEWVQSYAEAIRAAGACPTEAPAEVVQLDGTMGPVMLEAFEPVYATAKIRAKNVDDSELSSPAYWVASEGEAPDPWTDCEDWDWRPETSLDSGEMGIYLAVTSDTFVAPADAPYLLIATYGSVARHDGSGWSFDEVVESGIGAVWDDPPYYLGGSYGFVCLDAYPPADGLEWGAAGWRGVVFTHTEIDGAPGLVSDVFWSFDEIPCVYAENAASYPTELGNRLYPTDCDGLDNDFDGEVDEGYDDNNRNGLADCLEGVPP